MKSIKEILEDIEYFVNECDDDNYEDSRYYLQKIIERANDIREILDLKSRK